MKRHIQQIRSFNRFYTAHLGLLNERLLSSKYSLTEARVLFEIGNRPRVTTGKLAEALFLDKGYLSRVINTFDKRGLVLKATSEGDKRSQELILTPKGTRELTNLQHQSDAQIAGLTASLTRVELDTMINAMRTISMMLTSGYGKDKLADAVTYRDTLRPGDLGYMIYLHGKLYAEESGYSMEFEGYVAKTFYEFERQYDRDHDKIWLALYNDEIVASIAILKRPRGAAQLRWFLVHPMFRGTGIGRKLFQMALNYCTGRFTKVYLMTADKQRKAIEMYQRAGFTLTHSEEVNQWGMRLREERYELTLDKGI